MNVQEAMKRFAEAMAGIDTGGVFGNMTCREVESMALVLVMFGHEGAAASVLLEHSDGDGEHDTHHELRDLEAAEPGTALEYVRELTD